MKKIKPVRNKMPKASVEQKAGPVRSKSPQAPVAPLVRISGGAGISNGVNREKTKKEHLYQGRLHSVKGEYKEAIEEYKKALKIDPNYKPAKVNLDFISYMKGPLNKDRCASNKHMKLGRKPKKGRV